MRDDEMKSAGYTFKCATLRDDEEYLCYLSEHDKSQDVVSKFMESSMGDKFEPSKDSGAHIVHREKPLDPDGEMFQFFRRSLLIMYYYISPRKIKRVVNYYLNQLNFLKRTKNNYNC